MLVSPGHESAVVELLTGGSVVGHNVVGVIRVTRAALPLLRRSESPVVVNVSSALGSFWAVTDSDWPASRVPVVHA